MTKKISADICIIGAGSGGLSVAYGASQLGKKVVLLEKGKMGGDCLNYGCVPSKAILAAGKTAQTMRDAAKYGVTPVEPSVDFRNVHNHIHSVIAAIEPHDSVERYEGLGVNVIKEAGRFISKNEVQAGESVIKAKFFVIATGSSAFIPPIEGLGDVPFLTNEVIFDLTEQPEHLIIIGGGPIGLEMSQAHRRLGSNVTVLEGSTILSKDDPELVEVVRENLTREGVDLREGAKVSSVSGQAGDITVNFEKDGVEQSIQGTHILIATGRKANLDGLDLEKAGIEYSPRGIKVDQKLRTTNKRVYGAGDITGGRQFTHVAGYHASLIIQHMLFKSPFVKNGEQNAPWVTYVDPELAHVGMTEEMAKAAGEKYSVARWSFDDNDRAQAEHATNGRVKAIIGKGGKVLGCSIVGKNAGDLINPWALAVANGLKIRAFTNMIAPYPTLGEVNKRVAGAYYTPTLFSGKTRTLIKTLSIFD
ncbi:NAD(P)/FAD-dependent oxidoreductase [Parvularcula sp. IMCC14364]|uniref:dihydrolipoyl dehydrogenase family protein n=1 Tax=Parvularcula sp. IMCC14364 TaxID=3067902 RepID=UPI00274082FF|nr:FAD-dependent oxidoreductase [Parvularcula sp. IMCC14364]